MPKQKDFHKTIRTDGHSALAGCALETHSFPGLLITIQATEKRRPPWERRNRFFHNEPYVYTTVFVLGKRILEASNKLIYYTSRPEGNAILHMDQWRLHFHTEKWIISQWNKTWLNVQTCEMEVTEKVQRLFKRTTLQFTRAERTPQEENLTYRNKQRIKTRKCYWQIE